MSAATNPNPETEAEETGSRFRLPAWFHFPKWTPKALIGMGWAVMAFVVFNVVNIAVRLLTALHQSAIPWWGIFFVYCFLGGAAFRAAKEAKAWAGGAMNRWGVFTRWAKGLV